MSRWVDVGALAELQFAPGALVEVEGERLAVFPLDGGYRAITNKCPHGDVPLCAGTQRGDQVLCPMHLFPFDLRTGACGEGAEWNVQSYAVRERAGRLEVEWPA